MTQNIDENQTTVEVPSLFNMVVYAHKFVFIIGVCFYLFLVALNI